MNKVKSEWEKSNLIRWDDEFKVKQVVLVRENNLTCLWKIQLIDVWHTQTERNITMLLYADTKMSEWIFSE